MRKRLFVGSLRGQGIIDIYNAHNSGYQRYFCFPKTVRISLSIPLFVMIPCDLFCDLAKLPVRYPVLDKFKKLSSDHGVHFHLFKFLMAERGCLLKNGILYGNLAHIVKRRTSACLFHHLGGKLFLIPWYGDQMLYKSRKINGGVLQMSSRHAVP